MATSLDASYGSDQTGMICGYLFRPGEPGVLIESTAVHCWLTTQREETSGEFLWLHFNLTNTASEKWLHKHLVLSEVYFEALHEGSRSTRIEYADGALIGVINDVLFDFSFEASEISTLWLSADPHLLISARSKPLRSIDKVRAQVRDNESFRSPVDLMVHLLRDQADVLMQIVRDASSKIDGIEDSLLARRLKMKRGELSAMRRVLVRLRRLLAPEPAALFRLLNNPPEWVTGPDVQNMRQATEEFSVVLNDIAALIERIKLLQEEIATDVNEQTNRSLYVLTIVTVLALPINIVAGLLGMNVGGIPLAEHIHGFTIVVAIIITFTVIAAIFAFRKRE